MHVHRRTNVFLIQVKLFKNSILIEEIKNKSIFVELYIVQVLIFICLVFNTQELFL